MLDVLRSLRSRLPLDPPGRTLKASCLWTRSGDALKPAWGYPALPKALWRGGPARPGKPGRLGVHGLRYSRASIGPELGEAAAVTAAILGQASGALTLDAYTTLPVEVLRSAAIPGWETKAETIVTGRS